MESPGSIPELLIRCLETGRHRIGEILLGRDHTLRHHADVGRTDLRLHRGASAARLIARFDGEGNYRPLKTAPNLPRGWLLETGSPGEMAQALEFFYPAALGLWLSELKGSLLPTPLRETLDRQTGMYRITQLLRDDQALELVADRCGGCLRTVLWSLSQDSPVTSLPESRRSLVGLPSDTIPLICRELCNLVVAAARPVAKGNLPKQD